MKIKQKKNNLRIAKLIFCLMFCVFINSCYECYSDVCWQEIERKKFLMLSPEQQKLKREECMKWVPVSCYTYSEPTSKELKKTH